MARVAEASRSNARVYLCPVVYYEVRRGLLERSASRQLHEFESLAASLLWVDFGRAMWDDAAQTWAACRRRGRPHDDDADLLIAAYARQLAATLVTINTHDFADLGVPLAIGVYDTERHVRRPSHPSVIRVPAGKRRPGPQHATSRTPDTPKRPIRAS